jgi:hypothetical protein
VNVWDGENKKRLSQLHPYPTSIASLAFRYADDMNNEFQMACVLVWSRDTDLLGCCLIDCWV